MRHRLDNKRVLEQLQHDLRLVQNLVILNVLTTPIYKVVTRWQHAVLKTLNPARRTTVCLILKLFQALMILHLWKRWCRRYKRLMNEGQNLPQLIVIDGGKGQLRSALKSLEKLNLHHTIAI